LARSNRRQKIVWASRDNHTSSHISTLVHHFLSCPNVTDNAAKARVRDAHAIPLAASTPPRTRRGASTASSEPTSPSPLAPSSPHYATSLPGSSTSRASSESIELTPGDSVSATGAIPLVQTRSLPVSRSSSLRAASATHSSSFFEAPPQPWTPLRKSAYEVDIARLTVACGFPLSWVENPEWIAFCERWIFGAPPISRYVLTTRIIPQLVTNFRNSAKSGATGKNATMQADGWTGTNNHHLVAFMATIDNHVRRLSNFLASLLCSNGVMRSIQ
jgi:hypothetical protein